MIFIDSCYFIGLFDKKDQWHKQAIGLLDQLENETLVLSEYHVSEILTEIGKRKGGKVANEIFSYFNDSCMITYTNPDVVKETERIFLKYDGKISFVDALAIRMMGYYKIYRIISFDSDFDKVKGVVRVH